MRYSPILATLIYVLSPDRKRVLLIHRNLKVDDNHYGKYNGLGGKLERDEDVVAGAIRETKEEAGIVVRSLSLRGTISWPGFGRKGEDWFGFIFRADSFEGEVFTKSEEGTLCWIDLDEVQSLPMWEGDKHFLPLVFSADPRQFHGVMPYEGGRPVSWKFSYV